jgi:excisionase family DNA binding protein
MGAAAGSVTLTSSDLPVAAPLDPDRLLTAEEAAAILRVTPRWVSDRGRDGRLRSVPLGRNRRYRRGTILAFIEKVET